MKPSYSLSVGLPLSPEQSFYNGAQTVLPPHVVDEKVERKAERLGPQEGATAGK